MLEPGCPIFRNFFIHGVFPTSLRKGPNPDDGKSTLQNIWYDWYLVLILLRKGIIINKHKVVNNVM